MTTRLATAIAVAALFAPSGAAAGGFATVGVDPLPDGIGAGRTWQVRLTILQHGRTPLEGLEPRVIVTRGAERRVFAARPAGRTGVYRAAVVFPGAGLWRYVVDDGFTMTHTFPPVRVRATGGAKTPSAPAAAGGGSDIPLAFGAAAGAGLVAALASAGWRRRRPAPESW